MTPYRLLDAIILVGILVLCIAVVCMTTPATLRIDTAGKAVHTKCFSMEMTTGAADTTITVKAGLLPVTLYSNGKEYRTIGPQENYAWVPTEPTNVKVLVTPFKW